MDINGSLFDGINELAGHVALFDRVMEVAAQYAVFAIVFIAAASWFVRVDDGPDHRIALYNAGAACVVAFAAAMFIQHFYVHQRPFVLRTDVVLLTPHSADPSFPSEHTTGAFAIAAGIGLYRHRFGMVLLALATLIAFARVYVGVHYPADVAAGAAVGILSAFAIFLLRPTLLWLDRSVVTRFVPQALI